MTLKKVWFFLLVFILLMSGFFVIKGRFKRHITNEGTFVYNNYSRGEKFEKG